ncbi:exonuclease domain-containing protein [Neisseriaceae bacterium TC5R-5]|nr:exonuclease domain-containing protein [Neisseriaceae bacterium TC5R-5]
MNPLFTQPCAIIDLETTGGNINRDRITEIGLILLDGERVERFECLVNPGQPIPPFIENMTGISDAMVAPAPAFAERAEGLLQKLTGRLLLAHNVRFDYGLLRNEFRRLGLRFQSHTLCTVKLSRHLYPQYFKHSLDSLIARHGIEQTARHRALADAEAVYAFLQLAYAEFGTEVLLKAAQEVQQLPPELACLPPALQEQLELLPDLPGVYTLYTTEQRPLYVNKARNLRQQVLRHFASAKAGKRVTPAIVEPILGVEWQETLGEFGAQLLELQQIRRLQPLYNHRGRKPVPLSSVQLARHEDGFIRPYIVRSDEIDFSRAADLYGLFHHAREARKVLLEIAGAHGLCAAVLGVETVTSRKGGACAALAQGRCRGACLAKEGVAEHNARLLSALARLKVKSWPFAAAIAVVETDEVTAQSREHVFDRWCYLGSRDGQQGLLQGLPAFDLECYKLLQGWLRKPVSGTALRQL